MKLIEGFSGFGDNIYQLPVVTELCKADDDVYLMTPVPQFYSRIKNLRFLKPNIPWRTQNAHMASIPESTWSKAPDGAFQHVHVPQPFAHRPKSYPGNRVGKFIKPELTCKFNYGPQELMNNGNILAVFERQAKIRIPGEIDFNMPKTRRGPITNQGKKKIAIIRPPTDRAEWLTPARQCNPQYTNYAAKELRKRGYYVVSIADVQPGKEWIVGDLPEADLYLHNRELSFMQTLSLVEHASVVVGGVGWIVPACIAYKKKVLFVLGGRGGFDCPEKITDQRMDLSRITWATPDRFCRCTQADHRCDKTISQFPQIFSAWLEG